MLPGFLYSVASAHHSQGMRFGPTEIRPVLSTGKWGIENWIWGSSKVAVDGRVLKEPFRDAGFVS